MNLRTPRLVSITVLLTTLLLWSGCEDTPTGTGSSDPEPYSTTEAPGEANNDIVAGGEFDTIELEIQYMPGYEPQSGAVEDLVTFLEEWSGKTVRTLDPVEIPAGDQPSYTANDVRSLEDEHREHVPDRTSGTLRLYHLFLDGEFEQENVLAIAYRNTSTAYFGATFEETTSGLGSPSREQVEASVLRHEIGHLMGLVDNGTNMQQDHKDEANGAHCDNENCVMYYAYNQPDLFSSMFGSEIPDLDAACQADLEALKNE